MAPTPMNATLILSFAPFPLPVHRDVVRAAPPALFRKSRRPEALGVVESILHHLYHKSARISLSNAALSARPLCEAAILPLRSMRNVAGSDSTPYRLARASSPMIT